MVPMKTRTTSWAALAVALGCLSLACAIEGPGAAEQRRWWAGFGPVIPHDSFPGDCRLCHVGEKWHTLVEDFEFDHERETGVALVGAHEEARCLRCHNDRGPVETFAAQGCGGCHEDVHLGELGDGCLDCHDQFTWRPMGMIAMHNRTRFPLVGVHAGTACRRCHPGAEVGRFTPTDVECLTCHADDLARTTNHVGLGWVDRCDRCHIPTVWEQAEVR